jgi:hypothetical protein
MHVAVIVVVWQQNVTAERSVPSIGSKMNMLCKKSMELFKNQYL